MNISFVASEKFLQGAKVMLVSFLVNNDFEEHTIYWLYTDVSEVHIREFCAFFKNQYNQVVIPFHMTQEMMEGFDSNTVFGPAAFHKLFIYKHLDIPGGRIMSLDADAIIDRSLKDFYYQEMEDYCIAASQDLYIRYTENEYLKHVLGLPQNHVYINLGNVLFNIDQFLRTYSIIEYADYTKNNPDKIKFVSQDIVNVLLKDQIKVCDAFRYNLQVYSRMNMPHSILYISKTTSKELKNQVKKAIKNQPVIIHYVRTIKPWDTQYCFGYRKYYRKYEKIAYGRGYVYKHDFLSVIGFVKKIVRKVLSFHKKKD